MPKTIVEIDLKQSPYKNPMIHNRWHPDVPIIAWVKPGDDFVMQTYDWTGGFIKNDESADDVRDIDLTIVHFLSGRISLDTSEDVAALAPAIDRAYELSRPVVALIGRTVV
jgi:formamidase